MTDREYPMPGLDWMKKKLPIGNKFPWLRDAILNGASIALSHLHGIVIVIAPP
jgi:hypothetical protein